MKTKEMIEWLEDMRECGCAIYPNEEEIIAAIIKSLQHYETLLEKHDALTTAVHKALLPNSGK